MKEKKTEVITFRTTTIVKRTLEEEAREKSWTVSQLTEKIIANYVKTKETEKQNRKRNYDSISTEFMGND